MLGGDLCLFFIRKFCPVMPLILLRVKVVELISILWYAMIVHVGTIDCVFSTLNDYDRHENNFPYFIPGIPSDGPDNLLTAITSTILKSMRAHSVANWIACFLTDTGSTISLLSVIANEACRVNF